MFPDNKQQIEQVNYAVAQQWHNGLNLTFAGVDLGDALEYPVLAVLGNVWLNHWMQTAPKVEPPAEAPPPEPTPPAEVSN